MIELSGNITGEVDGQQMVLLGEGNELLLEVDHPDQGLVAAEELAGGLHGRSLRSGEVGANLGPAP